MTLLGRLQRIRRRVKARTTPYKAILGDASNNVYAEDGYYWVRPYNQIDTNGFAAPGAAYRVRVGSALIVPRAGRVVWVGPGLDTRLTVLGYDHDDLIQAGINPQSVQPNDPYRIWVRLKDIQNFRALPIATGSSPGMLVQVRQLFYYTETGDMVRWNGTSATTQIDLTAYVPGAELQRYVVLWLRVYNPNGLDDIQVTASTSISSLNAVLSFDDLQECANGADPDTIPIGAFRLADAQTTLVIDDTIDVDLRQFMNMPQVWGFPNTVSRAYRVHEGFSVIAPSAVIVESGGVVQIQDNALLMILSESEAESGGGGSEIIAGDGLQKSGETLSVDSTVVRTTGVQTVSDKVIENSSIGLVTRALGYFSALRLYIGGFFGIFTHSNTADRTYTLPNYNATLSPMTTQGDTVYHNGTDNVRLAKGTALQQLRMNSGATAPEWFTPKNVTKNVQYFSGSGTWTKPSGAFLVQVTCVGSGGGGGSGRRATGGAHRGGGGGGGAGYVTTMVYAADQLAATEGITIIGGGAGGAARTVNDQNGFPGADGGPVTFGAHLYATGGGGGGAGVINAGGAGGTSATVLTRNFQYFGSTGAAGGASSTAPGATPGALSPGGGGGGGGINSGGAAQNPGGGASAQVQSFGDAAAGTGGTAGSGGAIGGDGADGVTDGTSTEVFGAGGGGGGSNGTAGFAGGNGGAPGGGGGGGSASVNGNDSGAGGNGADGGVLVITYCWA